MKLKIGTININAKSIPLCGNTSCICENHFSI